MRHFNYRAGYVYQPEGETAGGVLQNEDQDESAACSMAFV
jgi:hypothetical protein